VEQPSARGDVPCVGAGLCFPALRNGCGNWRSASGKHQLRWKESPALGCTGRWESPALVPRALARASVRVAVNAPAASAAVPMAGGTVRPQPLTSGMQPAPGEYHWEQNQAWAGRWKGTEKGTGSGRSSAAQDLRDDLTFLTLTPSVILTSWIDGAGTVQLQKCWLQPQLPAAMLGPGAATLPPPEGLGAAPGGTRGLQAGKVHSGLQPALCEDKWGQNGYFVRIPPGVYIKSASRLHFVDEHGHISANLEMSVIPEIFAIPW